MASTAIGIYYTKPSQSNISPLTRYGIYLILGLAIYFSIEETTQFLTTDEAWIVEQSIGISKDDLLQWMHGAMQTSFTFMSPFSLFAHKLNLDLKGDFIRQVWKSFHWLGGFLMILVLSNSLRQADKNQEASNDKMYFIFLVAILLLLPSNNLALKVYNYDLQSMILTVVATVYLVRGFLQKNLQHAAAALALSALASQEKLSAGPVLELCMLNYIILAKEKAVYEKSSSQFLESLKAIATSLLIPGSIFLCSHFIVFCIRLGNVPYKYWISAFDPMTSCIRPIWFFTLGRKDHENFRSVFMFLQITVCVLFGLFSYVIAPHLISWRKSLTHHLNKFRIINSILILFIFIGVVLFYHRIQLYWAPFRSISKGHYQPVSSFNEMIWHFDAPTFISHLLSYIGYSYIVFIAAIPSVLLFSSFVGFFKKNQLNNSDLIGEILISFGILMTGLFGLFQVPVMQKYLNIPILFFVIGITLRLRTFLFQLKPKARYIALTLLFSGVFFEVIPFRPLFGPFRPIWINYDNKVSSGKMNPSWVGWGEEVMLAGKWITEKCQPSCQDITLHYGYNGRWLNPKSKLKIVPFDSDLNDTSLLTENHFYVINRSAFIQDRFKFPEGVHPIHVIQYRGFDMAWIYRGDQLREKAVQWK